MTTQDMRKMLNLLNVVGRVELKEGELTPGVLNELLDTKAAEAFVKAKEDDKKEIEKLAGKIWQAWTNFFKKFQLRNPDVKITYTDFIKRVLQKNEDEFHIDDDQIMKVAGEVGLDNKARLRPIDITGNFQDEEAKPEQGEEKKDEMDFPALRKKVLELIERVKEIVRNNKTTQRKEVEKKQGDKAPPLSAGDIKGSGIAQAKQVTKEITDLLSSPVGRKVKMGDLHGPQAIHKDLELFQDLQVMESAQVFSIMSRLMENQILSEEADLNSAAEMMKNFIIGLATEAIMDGPAGDDEDEESAQGEEDGEEAAAGPESSKEELISTAFNAL